MKSLYDQILLIIIVPKISYVLMIPFDKFLEMALKMKCLMTAYYMV